MLQAIVKKGNVIAEEVPIPGFTDYSVLIKVAYSSISAGTEITSVNLSKKSLVKKVIEKPKKVTAAIDVFHKKGIKGLISKVHDDIEKSSLIGYSLSGIVVGVGKKVKNVSIGDRVSAAGAGYANHAEYVSVPSNLVMKLPAKLGFKEASTVTLGGIALQGVRRADPKLGEIIVVFGVGIIGLITVRLLVLSGARVIAVDIDNRRLEKAKTYGALLTINPLNHTDYVNEIINFSGGYGVDKVVFTAHTQDETVISNAFKMCRKKGKVILVGVAGDKIKREDIYVKEIDLLISTSYGPGRYDVNYEDKGLDYPYAYVRWTENRNMTEYLKLLSEKKIDLNILEDGVYDIKDVKEAYDSFNKAIKPLILYLKYSDFNKNNSFAKIKISTSNKITKDKKILKVGLVGLGAFAKNTHIPNLLKLKDKFEIDAIMSHQGLVAKEAALKYKARYATTSFDEIISDNLIDLVFISTRHDSHADYVLRALEAGKHVFVEKPLAVNEVELNKIRSFYESKNKTYPLLMVGFNRRFSKYAKEIEKFSSRRIGPLFISYRMNAGFIPLDHWVHEHGGRMIGEVCHIIDLMTFFTKSRIKRISFDEIEPFNSKYSASDNKAIILRYEDGSICNINYFSMGNKNFPKEYMEMHFDDKTIVLDDYKTLKGYGVKINEIQNKESDKGLLDELIVLYESLINGSTFPIELWDLFQTTQTTFSLIR